MSPNSRNANEHATRRGLFGWVMFDWATQPFYTLVVTFLFAPYFVNGFMDDPAYGQTLWAYATGGAQLIAALLAPVLGAIADAGLPRKPWIAVFSALLIAGLCGLWFAIPGEHWLVPFVLVSFGAATLGAELATVFTNSMMPGLISDKRLGTLSGVGWAAGYVGGLISLALVAGLLVADPTTGKTLLGLDPLIPIDPTTREGDRLIGPFSALWYFVFVLPLFLFTPDQPNEAPTENAVRASLGRLAGTMKDLLRHHRTVALFLLARMLYADGLGAVFAFGGIYAASVFGWGATELGLFGILLTIAGTIGAGLGGLLDDRLGSKAVIVGSLLLFIAASIGVLSIDADEVLFVIPVAPKLPASGTFSSPGEQAYLLFAMIIGLSAGPIQASSRTLLARICPPGKTTEFFGFFSFSGKISAFAAPLAIGAVTALTDSQRLGISASLVFLVGGLLLLLPLKAR
ncbi:MAG: MFS transporter [Hyphomicrobiaceae bacterium]|nr:MFS transporter [Hyphomicrobiaceae bacterium]MDX2450348.1 MFS transporter [Hyphomicrobiaceae bacterium]